MCDWRKLCDAARAGASSPATYPPPNATPGTASLKFAACNLFAPLSHVNITAPATDADAVSDPVSVAAPARVSAARRRRSSGSLAAPLRVAHVELHGRADFQRVASDVHAARLVVRAHDVAVHVPVPARAEGRHRARRRRRLSRLTRRRSETTRRRRGTEAFGAFGAILVESFLAFLFVRFRRRARADFFFFSVVDDATSKPPHSSALVLSRASPRRRRRRRLVVRRPLRLALRPRRRPRASPTPSMTGNPASALGKSARSLVSASPAETPSSSITIPSLARVRVMGGPTGRHECRLWCSSANGPRRMTPAAPPSRVARAPEKMAPPGLAEPPSTTEPGAAKCNRRARSSTSTKSASARTSAATESREDEDAEEDVDGFGL